MPWQLLGQGIVTNAVLIFILMLPGMIYGLVRGWQEEGFTAIGLAITVSVLGERIAEAFILIVNRLIGIFPLAFAIIANKPPDQWPGMGENIIPLDNMWAQLVMFALMCWLSYKAGSILGHRKGLHLFGRLAGATFGALNVILMLARLLVLFNPLDKEVVIKMPTIRILGMPSNLLSGFLYLLILIIFLLFLGLAYMFRKRASD